MKNYFKKIMIFILCFASLFTLVACNDETEQTGFKDTIARPDDIPPLAELEYVKYPEKPKDAPSKGEGMPQVGTATTDSEYYKINQADGKITVTFNEVGKWDYIYLPITNFNAEYQNIRITATGTNVQKFACTAIYYEMYDNGAPAVTTLISDIGDTEQFYIMELGKLKLLDASYYETQELLGNQTVIGLCIFIDSNPSLQVINKNTDIESKFEITSIDFLPDGDDALNDRYVAPSLNVGYCDLSYSVEKNNETKEFTIVKDKSAALYEAAELNISNYSSEYSAFTLKFTTQNVRSISVELIVSGQSTWQPNVGVYAESNLVDGEHEVYIDFSSVEPIGPDWNIVPGYYIKNYKITAIRFFLDTTDPNALINETSTMVINSLEFERIASDSTVISKGWSVGSPDIILGSDLAVGGVGTIEYYWYNQWYYLTMPILNYETKNSLVVKFEAPDGIDYIGIALSSGSYVENELVLKSCHDPIASDSSVITKSGLCEGVVETVTFDSTTNIYTISFDFTNAVKADSLNGKSMNEVVINSLRFYFTDDVSGNPTFDGTRTIRFVSVEFK